MPFFAKSLLADALILSLDVWITPSSFARNSIFFPEYRTLICLCSIINYLFCLYCYFWGFRGVYTCSCVPRKLMFRYFWSKEIIVFLKSRKNLTSLRTVDGFQKRYVHLAQFFWGFFRTAMSKMCPDNFTWAYLLAQKCTNTLWRQKADMTIYIWGFIVFNRRREVSFN